MPSLNQALSLADSLPGDSPRLDAQLILCHVLDCNTAYLRTWPDKELSQEQWQQFQRYVAKRQAGHPIAYLLGRQDFWSLELEVSSRTLIPRSDTETLVEHVLTLKLPQKAKVLDLGTGTGAIALALAKERPAWQVLACDFEPEITALAERNATRNGISNCRFVTSHWFDEVRDHFDLIVSNPPYIASNDPHLQEGDLRFEARSALVAEDQGYADLAHIVDAARAYANEGAYVMLEHGFEQGERVREFFTQAHYRNVQTLKDLPGLERVTMAQWFAH